MKKLVIQLWQTNFKSIELAATPFLMATTAAAMDIDVEIHATGFCVSFFMKEQPHLDQLVASSNRPLREYVNEAISCGVKVYLCSMALRDRDITPPLLREGVEIVGLVTMLDRSTDPETTVLVY